MAREDQRATLAELFAGRLRIGDALPWGGLALMHEAQRLDAEETRLALAVLPVDCESDPAQAEFRSLRADTRDLDTNLSWAKAYLDTGVTVSANVAYERSDSRSINGLNLVTLTDADLRDVDLTGAKLRDAKLSGVDLERAELDGIDLCGANAPKLSLPGARLLRPGPPGPGPARMDPRFVPGGSA